MGTRAKRLTTAALCVVIIATLGFGAWNGARPVAAISPTKNVLATQTSPLALAWPTQGAAAVGAIGMGVLATQGPQTPRPIASVAKIITSLAVLKHTPLALGEQGPTYTITDADVARLHDYVAHDGSTVPVTVGEQLTQYQALEALLLPSANNVADSLAIWTFGSLDAYHAYANQMVQALGMAHTTVAGDASGLLPATVSTPADLISLGEAALANPVIAQIVAQPTADLPVAGTVHNVNILLGNNGVIGIKTGNSDEAGGCLLAAAVYEMAAGQKITAVTAVLGAPTLSAVLAATNNLLASVKAGFSYQTVLRAGQTVASYTLPWGGTVTAVAKTPVSFVRWNGDNLTFSPALDKLNHGVAKGSHLGTVTINAGTKQYASEIVASQSVSGPNWWWRATRFKQGQ